MRTGGPGDDAVNVAVNSQDGAVTFADDIVTGDGDCRRSRIDNNSSIRNRDLRDTAGSRQRNHDSIDIGRHLIVIGIDILAERALVSTRNLNTISEPSVNSALSIGRSDGGSQVDLSTVADGIQDNTVHRDRSHNRTRIDRDGDLIGVEAGGRCLVSNHTHGDGLIVSGRVGSRVSTRNIIMIGDREVGVREVAEGIIASLEGVDTVSDFVPLIDHVLSVRIHEVSSQGDFAAFANLGLSSSDVHNRLRIDVHKVLCRSGSATGSNAFSLNLDSESVRLNASIPVFAIELVVTIAVSHVISDHTTLVPSVMQGTHIATDGINIGDQEDGVGLTDMLIACDHNGRVRVDGEGSGSNRQRSTSRRSSGHDSRVDVLLRVVVNRDRRIIDGLCRSTRDEDTVSVPSIDIVGRRNVVASISCDCDLSALANNRVRQGDVGNNRIRNDIHRDGIAGSLAEGVELLSREGVHMVAFCRNNRVSQGSGTSNQVAVVIPVVFHVRGVPVVQISSQGDFTTNADQILGNFDIDNRQRVNINLGFSRGLATVFVHQGDAEVVRVVSVLSGQRDGLVVSTGSASDNSIVFKPCEGVGSGRLRIDVSNHRDVAIVVAADDRICLDGKRRVRVNSNRVSEGHDGLATVGGLFHGNFIDVHRRVVADSVRSLGEGSTNSVRNDFAVSVPCEDLTTGDTTVHGSFEGHGTTIAQSLAGGQVIGDGDGRISVDGHSSNIADSAAMRVELLSGEGVVVNTRCRNNRVGQGGSTSNQVAVVIPVVFHVRGVPVVQVGSQGNFTTNTNIIFSRSDVDHRNRINIDLGLSRSLATIFVHQGDAEVVRIISVFSGQRDGLVMSASGTSQSNILFKPVEAVSSGRLRIDMGNHGDVAIVVTADDRIGFDHNSRVGNNRQSVSEGNDRLATVSRLLNRNFIDIDRRIIANCMRGLCEDRTDSIRNNFTISVPSEDLTTGDTTVDSSNEGHGTTVAESLAGGQVISNGDGRISVDIDRHNIAGSLTEGVELLSREGVVVSTGIRNNRVGQGSGTKNQVAVVIPVEFHVRSVPVVEVSSQGDFTTNANLSLSSRDIDHRNSINIDRSFIRSLATIFVHQDNAEVIRIISVRSGQRDGVVVSTRHARGQQSVIFIPVEAVSSGGFRLDVGNHDNITSVVTTNDRISLDCDSRVRNNSHSVSEGNDRLTAVSRLLDRHFIDIHRRVVADSVRSLGEGSTNSVRNDFAVSVPCEDLTTGDTTVHGSFEGHGTTIAQSLAGGQVIGDGDGRISMDVHSHSIADSAAMRVELLGGEGVNVSTRIRNNRVGQGGSTRNQDIIVIPVIFHVRSVPVVEVSGQGDLATNANLILSRSDIDHRKSVNVDYSFIRSLATIFVHQGNAEVIRVVSVFSGENNGVIVSASSTVQNNIVFEPVEGVSSGGLRIDMSNHHDITIVVTADNRIGFDLDRRIRVDDNGIGNSDDGFATSRGLSDRDLIDISGRVIADSVRGLGELRTNSIRNDLAISVPCEDFAARDTTSDSCREGHGTTVAEGLAIRQIVGEGHNRIRIDMDGDLIVVIANGVTTRVVIHQVSDVDEEGSGFSEVAEHFGSVRTTRHQVARIDFVTIPFEDQHRIIVVIDTSLQFNFAAFADKSIGSEDVDNRSSVNFNLERLRESGTTVTIDNFNHIGHRIMVSGFNHFNIHVVMRQAVVGQEAISVPFVDSIHILTTIGHSGEVNIRRVNVVEANIVDTIDDDDRVTSHMNSVGIDRIRNATRNIDVDVSLIGVHSTVVVKDPHLLGELIVVSKRHQEAILLPNVTESGIGRAKGIHDGGNRNLSAFADINVITMLCAIDSSHRGDLRRVEEVNGIRTSSVTTRGGLGNRNGEDSRIFVDGCREDRLGSIRNQHTILEPLIDKVLSVVVAEVSRSGNFTTLTDCIVINRDSHEDGIFNIHIVRIALGETTIGVGSVDREDVRMVLSREVSLQNRGISTKRMHIVRLTRDRIHMRGSTARN